MHDIINPRRACAARVTVLGLCVSVSVCLSVSILALQAMTQLMSDANSFSKTSARKLKWRFAKTITFEIEKPAQLLTTLRDPTHNNCARMRIHMRSTHTHHSSPAATPQKAWSPSSLTSRRQRTCSQALLFSAFYCCFQSARNWLTGSDDKYRTLAGTRGPSSAAASDTA